MKFGIIRGISSKDQIILEDSNGSFHEMHFEGFQISHHYKYRSYFDSLINKKITCSFGKNYKYLRYYNFELFQKLISVGAVRINENGFRESKIYTLEEKNIFQQCEVNQEQDTKQYQFVNYQLNRHLLFKKWNKVKNIEGKIEYLNEEILIRITNKSEISYLPVSLEQINTYFHCMKQTSLTSLIIENNHTLKIDEMKVIYNLQHKKYQVRAVIEEKFISDILRNGWGTLRMSHANVLKVEKIDQLLKCQKQASLNHKGIFQQSSKVLNLIYTKNNFVGTVTDIFEGYIYEVMSNLNQKKIRIQMSQVWCPIDNELGAYDCREFARHNLIGRQVNVYLNKNSGLNFNGSIIRVSDSKDIEILLLQNGWGYLRQEYKNTLIGAKGEQCQRKAKQYHKGLHRKEIGNKLFEQLSQQLSVQDKHQLMRREELLRKISYAEEGMIDSIIDSLTYRVRLHSKKVIIRVRLEGVIGLSSLNSTLLQVRQLKEKVRQYLDLNFKKRTIQIIINQYDKNSNCYIGTIRLEDKKSSFQELLIAQSMVYVDKKNIIHDSYIELEKKCRNRGKNIWSQKLIPLQPIDLFEEQLNEFEGRFSWIQNARDVFIQSINSYQIIDQFQQILNTTTLKQLEHKNIIIGGICAAPYLNDYYRARILSVKSKKIEVLFIDWGNREIVQEHQLFSLPVNAFYTLPQCFKVQMYLWSPIRKNKDVLERVQNQLLEVGTVKFTKMIGMKVEAYKDQINLNMDFIEKGFIRADKFILGDQHFKEILLTTQQNLRKQRIGIWEWSDEQESSSQDYFGQKID